MPNIRNRAGSGGGNTLSIAAARRIALAAQGFADQRPAGPIDRGHLLRLLRRLQLHQIDSVNVLSRAHYLPAFARLGAYDRTLLDSLAWARPKRLFEYWAHEASLLPMELHPLLRWRMARAESGEGVWRSMKAFGGERRAEAEAVLERIAAEGPMAASEFEDAKGSGGWWGWSGTKAALEYLFWIGRISTATRRASFERVYDLTERVIPAAIRALPTPTEADAQRALIERSARALGVATAADLRDYFRLSPADSAPRIAELVEECVLIPVAVEDWRQPAFLHAEARRPRKVEARALLVPFDPLIWDRARTERLFGLRYRIEIYTPAHKRVHGSYVLPFLLGETIAARVDLKADRKAGTLRVQASHAEPGAPAETAERLAVELRLMADWLGLESISVANRGDLASRLRDSLPPTRGRG
ncbi:MAG: winged helix-turn-helix domain-containing protein [Allosphingosinicella sp.]